MKEYFPHPNTSPYFFNLTLKFKLKVNLSPHCDADMINSPSLDTQHNSILDTLISKLTTDITENLESTSDTQIPRNKLSCCPQSLHFKLINIKHHQLKGLTFLIDNHICKSSKKYFKFGNDLQIQHTIFT